MAKYPFIDKFRDQNNEGRLNFFIRKGVKHSLKFFGKS